MPSSVSTQSRQERKGWAFVIPTILWTVAFFIVPFAVMVVVSLWKRVGTDLIKTLSVDNYLAFFEKSHYVTGLVNSLEITITVTIISLVLAYPLAWIIAERIPRRWQRLALVLAILPFWTSYVVRSYAWLLVLSRNGFLNQALVGLGVIDQPLELVATRTATTIGFVHFFVMLLTLTIYANLIQLSPNYRRAAADLGANAFQTFYHVVLPLTIPGVMVGVFLTFVLTMGDYITPQILGGNNELVLPQIIMLQIGRRADFPSAAALSIILMGVVSIGYLLCARWLKLDRV